MTPIKKQVVRSGEIAGTVGVNITVVQVILNRIYSLPAIQNLDLTELEKGIILAGVCSTAQVLYYLGKKFTQKYMGGI